MTARTRRTLGLLFGLTLLSAAATAMPAAAQTPGEIEVSTALRPGDVVALRIWREPDLSGEFPIDENGVAVFPRIGSIEVAGKDPQELKAQLVEAYSETLRNPSIEVILLRRISIAGEVRSPGVYKVDPTITVAEALTIAGGALPNAQKDRILIVREGRRIEIETDGSVDLQRLAIQSGDQIVVPQRSWFVRNWPIVGSVLSAGISLFVVLTR